MLASFLVGWLAAISVVSHGMRIVDLRSDTVTKPTKRMRERMLNAEVGDDVFEEDPTILELESRVATMFGKEKALFFPSGTMSNLAGAMAWCEKRGSEMIMGDNCHMYVYEQGGLSQLGGIFPRPLKNEKDGTIDLESIENAVRVNNIHFPSTELIAVENTHNVCGGKILPEGYMNELAYISRSKNIPVHMDGARIWNAAEATGESLDDLVSQANSVSVCLSKGLGAPSGSLLLGDTSYIERSRRIRKVLGGGMRQIGILGEAGLQALDDFGSGILRHDHANARRLAEGLQQIRGFSVDLAGVQTNILFVNIDFAVDSGVVGDLLTEKGLLSLPKGARSLRLVTHRDIDSSDVDAALAIFSDVSDILARDYKCIEPQPVDAIVQQIQNEVESGDVTDRVNTADMATDATSATIAMSMNEARDDIVSDVIEEEQVAEELVDMSIASSSSTDESSTDVEGDMGDDVDLEENDEEEGSILQSVREGSGVCYEEGLIYGMSVSESGFCVFLRGLVSGRVLLVPVTPADPMADGLDTEIPETSEAVTLLQLLQGIDVESFLAKDALNNMFFYDTEAIKETKRVKVDLKRLVIDDAIGSKSFRARLCGMLNGGLNGPSNGNGAAAASGKAGGGGMNAGEVNAEEDASPVPARGSSNTAGTAVTSAPSGVPPTPPPPSFVDADAVSILSEALQINRDDEDANDDDNDDSLNTEGMFDLETEPIEEVDKEVIVENAFQALALTLRHKVDIYIASHLLFDQQMSYSQDELNECFPQMLYSVEKKDIAELSGDNDILRGTGILSGQDEGDRNDSSGSSGSTSSGSSGIGMSNDDGMAGKSDLPLVQEAMSNTDEQLLIQQSSGTGKEELPEQPEQPEQSSQAPRQTQEQDVDQAPQSVQSVDSAQPQVSVREPARMESSQDASNSEFKGSPNLNDLESAYEFKRVGEPSSLDEMNNSTGGGSGEEQSGSYSPRYYYNI